MPTTGPPLRVAVYGSCVARDTFARLPADRFALVDYVARQSLVAAAAPTADGARFHREDALTSRFQRRVTRSSLLGDLDARLAAVAADVDALLWDLTDERLGVYAMPDDGFVTRTVELIASGADAEVARVGRLVEFGTDEHLSLWTRATVRWFDALARLRLDDRVLLLRAPWATTSRTGAEAPSSYGVTAARFNAVADRYYATVARSHPTVAVVAPDRVLLSSPDNVWGEAPFHFDEPSYAALATAVVGAIDGPGAAVPRPVVTRTSATEVTVTTARTWGASFALYVLRDGEQVTRLPYQRDPVLRVPLAARGRHGFRVFHRSADRGLVRAATTVARV